MSLSEEIIYESENKLIKLIESGTVDLNERDRYGFNPLIQAIIKRKDKVIESLVHNGADLEQEDYIGRTPLQWAAERGELEICYFLLRCGANPNHYSAEGQPILVYPILRQQLEIVEVFLEFKADYQFAQDYISAKLLGHRFELTGEADILAPDGNFIPISFEGFMLEFTTGLLQRSLHNYLNSIAGNKYEYLQPYVQRTIQTLRNAAQLVSYARHKDRSPFQEAISVLLGHELLVLPVAFKGHAITFIKYGNLWAKCDRGVASKVDSVVVFEIGNPYAINMSLCNKLLYEKNTEEFILREIPEELGLKTLCSIPAKNQITGNCSWANVEASVSAMLFLLQYDPNEHYQSSLAKLTKSILQFSTSWINWDQDLALDEAIEDFEAANLDRQITGAMILGSILVQRCNPDKKLHVDRAKKIFAILTQDNFKFILESYVRVFFSAQANKNGSRVKKLFKVCEVDPKTLSMKRSCQYIKTNVHSENLVRMTTALHVACLTGQLSAVKHLVEKLPIDVDYIDRTGSTALMYAAWKGYLDIVKYLIKNKANPNIKNLKGGTAIRYAAYSGHQDIVAFLKKVSR